MRDLLSLYDEDFVRAAYFAVLGRAPDRTGVENYLAQVRSGTAREQILAELAQSEEGQRRAMPVAGLPEVTASHPRPVPSVWARAFRRLSSASFDAAERHMRAQDNRLYVLEQALVLQTALLGELLARAGTTAAGAVASATSPAAAAAVASRLPSHLARRYAELMAAIEAKHRRP